MGTDHQHMPEVINRLARIEGHVKGIRNMAEQGKSCEDLLLQVSAVRAALDKVGKIILKDHLDNCLVDIVNKRDDKQALEQLKEAIDKFIK